MRDRPDLGAVDATCTACGWHYTTAEARAELEREEREQDACSDAATS